MLQRILERRVKNKPSTAKLCSSYKDVYDYLIDTFKVNPSWMSLTEDNLEFHPPFRVQSTGISIAHPDTTKTIWATTIKITPSYTIRDLKILATEYAVNTWLTPDELIPYVKEIEDLLTISFRELPTVKDTILGQSIKVCMSSHIDTQVFSLIKVATNPIQSTIANYYHFTRSDLFKTLKGYPTIQMNEEILSVFRDDKAYIIKELK